MIKFEMTHHASVDRLDRLAACVQYLGMSEFVLEQPDTRYPNTVRCLTSTGIIVVRSTTTNRLITGFMATPKQVCAMYKGQRVPQALYNTVVRNNKKFAFLAEMG